MATRTAEKLSDKSRGFDVKIEQTVGRVIMDGSGESSPIDSAFAIIAGDHQDRNGQDADYTFPGPDAGQVIRVEVRTTQGHETKGYF